MFRIIGLTAVALLLSTANLRAADAPADPAAARQAEVAQCVAVIGSDVPHEQKLAACKRLGRIGDGSVVPALAPLLTDEALSHPARIALEAIADPAAGEALRAALPKTQGRTLIGIIHSLGVRQETAAVPDVIALLSHGELPVASAAAASLGMIGSPEAVAALESALAAERPKLRAAAAGGLLRCAAARQAAGDLPEAARISNSVRLAEVPKFLRAAGIRGAVLAGQEAGLALLTESLRASEGEFFAAAMEVSRELTGASATAILAAALSDLPAQRQALVIVALGDRGDAAARDAVLQAARSDAPIVRAAALKALGQLGDASAIPVLLAAAKDPQGEVSAAAREGLTALTGEAVDAAVVAALADNAAPAPFLVELLGRRRIAGAVPKLLTLADAADPEVRLAALAALGKTIGPEQLGELTQRLLAATEPRDVEVLRQALTEASLRAVDRSAAAIVLAEALARAEEEGAKRVFLLELLGKLGGPKALEAVVAEAGGSDPAMQDAATRVLGKWPTPDAAPQLLELVRSGLPARYEQRVLHGLVRIVRQMDLPNETRLALLHEAIAAAERDEERRLAVEALGRIPTREALAEAVARIAQPALREAACAAAVATAEALAGSDPAAVVEPMKQVLAAATDAEVIRRAGEVLAAARPAP